MIEVTITRRDVDGVVEELGYIKIVNVTKDGADIADYVAQFAAERVGAVGLHRRVIQAFPRTKYNVLALVRQALATLDESELELEDGSSSADLARRQRRAGQALPREATHPVGGH